MDISSRGLDFIKRKEGYFSRAYLCPAGVATIGWGSIRWDAKRPVKLGDTCTEEQATRLLLKEVQRVEDAIDATVKVTLTQGQFDCLVSWGYNVGIGWITGKAHQQATLIKKLNAGRYDAVPSELLKFSRTTGGKRLDGLYDRRSEEVKELWMGKYGADAENVASGVIVDTDPEVNPMPQSVAPEMKTTASIVQESGTAKVAIVGFLSAVIAWVQSLFGVVSDAGAELTQITATVGPFNALLVALKANMVTLTITLAAVAFVVVMIRKLQEHRS